MTKSTTTYASIAGLKGVYLARSGALNSFAIALKTKGLCLYSPVAALAGADGTFLDNLGGVSVLLAPNHYHNKGLKSHSEQHPGAERVCSEAAKPRLCKITGLSFKTLETLRVQLPESMQILHPEGLKTGEVWMQIQHGETVAWIVTDAFSADRLPPREFNTVPSMLGAFPKFGVMDAPKFKSWVAQQIAKQAPNLVLPCHGAPVRHPNLGEQLLTLLDRAL